jgi:hypothetical protein
MSVGLDDRARKAAAGLNAAVDQASLREGAALPVRPPIAGRWVMAAGAMAGLVVLLLLVPRTEVVAPQSASSTTAAPTSTTGHLVPTTAAGVVPSPTTLPPAEPTTTVAQDTTPPAIEILRPEDGAVLEEKTVRFSGTTEPGASVHAGPYAADVNASGEWSLTLVLAKGSNRVTFQAEDAAGNVATAVVTVGYQPEPPPTTSTTEAAEIQFKAHAKWLTCESFPPFDEYYGTAPPGTLITVSSEYGGGSTEAGPSGEWYLKVYFETAPYGESFNVTVSAPEREPFVFPFTSYAA